MIGERVIDDPAAPDAPWAMPLVVRDERVDRPTRTAVCEAAAIAVVRLLTDERTTEGPWGALVDRWVDGRIRKVVRRGRGARWAAVQSIDGVTVSWRGAEVRAFVPGPTDALPPDLAKLQVAGLELDELGTPALGMPVTITVTPHAVMSPGKTAAQCGHAAQLAWMSMDERSRKEWATSAYGVRVVFADPPQWTELCRTAPVSVEDGGFTEIEPGTKTALASWSL